MMNLETSTQWISINVRPNIHCSQMIYPSVFGDSLTFLIVPPGVIFNHASNLAVGICNISLKSQQLLDGLH